MDVTELVNVMATVSPVLGSKLLNALNGKKVNKDDLQLIFLATAVEQISSLSNQQEKTCTLLMDHCKEAAESYGYIKSLADSIKELKDMTMHNAMLRGVK